MPRSSGHLHVATRDRAVRHQNRAIVMTMAPGRLGTYRLLTTIGAGGMGEVWLAEHTTLGRRAAVKVLKARYSSDSDTVRRFFNEAKAASAIAHPGIVQIFDYGESDDGTA